MISSLWGFSAAEAREYFEALAAGDGRAWRRLFRRNRAFVARSQRDFSREVGAALCAAPVSAISVR